MSRDELVSGLVRISERLFDRRGRSGGRRLLCAGLQCEQCAGADEPAFSDIGKGVAKCRRDPAKLSR